MPPPLLTGNPHELVLAAFKPARGPLQLYEGLAVSYLGRGRAAVLANQRSTAHSRASLAAWVTEVRHDPAHPLDQPPSPGAWTALSIDTLPDSDANQSLTVTITTYRLNDINSGGDWYLVATNVQDAPSYSGCSYSSQCGPYESSRSVSDTSTTGSLFGYGPTGTITSSQAGFTIGGDLSAGSDVGAGVQASWSQSWSQPSVTTTDNSKPSNDLASWSEAFDNSQTTSSYGSWPLSGPSGPPGTVSGSYQSDQAAIFQVPEGTTSFTANLSFASTTETDSGWWTGGLFGSNGCPAVYVCWWENFDTLEPSTGVDLYPPDFSVSPSSLTLSPGSSATINVTDVIPNSSQGLAWTASTNNSSAFAISPISRSTSASVTVTALSGAPLGSPAGYVYLDTNPSFAAPALEQGEISVPINVTSTTTTTTPSGYSYSATWQGTRISLDHVPNKTVESLPDAQRVGTVGDFETNDPTYSCLDKESINVFTAPNEYPGDYVVHNGDQGSQCIYGTWTFPT